MNRFAFPTDDGETISQHLGQARFFKVIQVEDGQVKSVELREKARHNHQDHTLLHETGGHPGQAMVEMIADCQTLIAGGMGQPMYERAKGLEVVLTSEKQITRALQSYLEGSLTSDPRRVHQY